MPNFIRSLFVKEIDELSAPLVAIFENKELKICGENLVRFDSASFSQVKGFKARGAKVTILPKQLTPKLAYFLGYFLIEQ